ncbi:MAG: lipid II flippase Amj family protein [Peptococcaceae bacterium]|nr:lipid II flippase Amj family protein [Peptococcaceae bacterium]
MEAIDLSAISIDNRVWAVFILTAFINLINTLVRSSRLAGVRTGRLATAISLFGVIFLAASFANTLQAPLLASTMEKQMNQAIEQAVLLAPDQPVTDSEVYQETLNKVNTQLRTVLCGATVGALFGLVLIPSFVSTFINIINAFNRTGSVFRLLPLFFFSFGGQARIKIVLRLTSWKTIKQLFTRSMVTPSAFLYWSALSYSIWTVNVLAGLFAAALFPEYRGVAATTAAIFGNLSIMLNVLMVDPILARVTDGVAAGTQQELELKQIIFFLALANVVGTLLSQLLFSPMAQLVLKIAIIIKDFGM